jgi:hypothetical protein
MSNRFRKFRTEKLEERQMMAGDINAYISDIGYGIDTLYIEEADGQAGRDNSVFIKQMTENTIRVLGTANADGSISMINGKQYQDFTIKKDGSYVRPMRLDVYLGRGNDTVNVTEFNKGATFFLHDVSINVRDTSGADPPDQDFVYVSYVKVRGFDNDHPAGRIRISTGAGNDLVSINQVSAENPYYFESALGIGTGAGADRVEVYNSSFSGNVGIGAGRETENDVDDLKMVNVKVWGDSTLDVALGGGNDTFSFDRITMDRDYWLGQFTLDAGAGNDIGSIKNVTAYSVKALLGEGSDTLALDYISAREMNLQGQGGSGDTLSKYHITVDKVFESDWETINGLPPLKSGLVPQTTLQILNPTMPATFNPTTLPTLSRRV